MKQFDSKGFMSYLPLMITGVIGLFIYNKFFKKTPEEQAEADAKALIAKNTVDSPSQSSAVVDAVSVKNATAGFVVTALHINTADGFFTKLKGAYPSTSDLDSIVKSISAMQIATLRLVVQAYGIRQKAVPFWDITEFADSVWTSNCTGNLIKHIQASMSPLQIGKISSKLNSI